MAFGDIPPVPVLADCIQDPTTPIGMRMRAAYFLKHIFVTEEEQREEVIRWLEHGLLEEGHGSLLRHEFAYVMGQLRDERVRQCVCVWGEGRGGIVEGMVLLMLLLFLLLLCVVCLKLCLKCLDCGIGMSSVLLHAMWAAMSEAYT